VPGAWCFVLGSCAVLGPWGVHGAWGASLGGVRLTSGVRYTRRTNLSRFGCLAVGRWALGFGFEAVDRDRCLHLAFRISRFTFRIREITPCSAFS
jgi:hypothetical protein